MTLEKQAKPIRNVILVLIILASFLFISNSSCNATGIAEMGLTLSSDEVSIGEGFTVTVYIDPSEAVGGWEINLSFNEGYVSANQVTNGSEWGLDNFDPGDIDNTIGQITKIQTWKKENYPNFNHTACEISFTANNAGVCNFELVHVQVTNSSFEDMAVSTVNATITITGGGSGNGSSGGNGGTPPANTPPVANTSGSETSGFVGTYIQFNGSSSYDPDEYESIKSWNWDFDDGETGTGETIEHIFFNEGIFNVTLTVTDNIGSTDTDTVSVTIKKGNNPPTKPEVTGPTTGHKNTIYEYTANSTDKDNDTISYIFRWGDEETTTTEFLPVGTSVTLNHSWSAAGRYTLEVQATDNETYSRTAELIVMIDAVDVGGMGYLTDDDGDDIYDMFHSDTVEIETVVEQQSMGNYLIDIDGDGKWDYIFDLQSGITTYHEEKDEEEQRETSGFELFLVICGVALVMLYTTNHRRI